MNYPKGLSPMLHCLSKENPHKCDREREKKAFEKQVKSEEREIRINQLILESSPKHSST